MAPEPDPAATWIATSSENLEADIKRLALSDWQLSQMPHGDLRKALKALEALRTIATGWSADATEVPMIGRDLAADVILRVIARELLGTGESDDT
jgi:hypothetical protein